jgi:hypothetical protein
MKQRKAVITQLRQMLLQFAKLTWRKAAQVEAVTAKKRIKLSEIVRLDVLKELPWCEEFPIAHQTVIVQSVKKRRITHHEESTCCKLFKGLTQGIWVI